MEFTVHEPDSDDPDKAVFQSLEKVVRGMGMSLVELSIFRSKKKRASQTLAVPEKEDGVKRGRPSVPKTPDVRIRAVVCKQGITGLEDCSKVHLGVMPRLELAFPGYEIYLEVSSPGIDRLIKDGSEFVHYIGREVRCFRTDISDWSAGVLQSADEKQIVLRGESGETVLPYGIIAKARLGASPL